MDVRYLCLQRLVVGEFYENIIVFHFVSKFDGNILTAVALGVMTGQ